MVLSSLTCPHANLVRHHDIRVGMHDVIPELVVEVELKELKVCPSPSRPWVRALAFFGPCTSHCIARVRELRS